MTPLSIFCTYIAPAVLLGALTAYYYLVFKPEQKAKKLNRREEAQRRYAMDRLNNSYHR